MKKVESYTLEDGNVIGIELEEVDRDQSRTARAVSRGGEGVSEDRSFTKIVNKIPMLTNSVFSALKEINEPKEVELEMGIKLSAKTGVVIASADSEAHFKLKIKWENKD